MTDRLGWLLGIAVVLTAAHGIVVAVHAGAGSGGEVTSDVRSPSQVGASNWRTTDAGAYEQLVVTVEIPAAGEVPAGGPNSGSCPKDQLGNILGITLAQPHGLVVKTVVPEGPAARAGIKPGDRLGSLSECPRESLGFFRPRSEPRQVEVTVRRPVEGGEEGIEAEEPVEETGGS